MAIDLVPAFKFTECEDLVLEREFPKEVKEKLWFAVPKPYFGDPTNRDLTFSVCAPQIERHLLNDKKNLKRSLRLLKSLRDKMKLWKLKSYFIRSIYMHENDRQNDSFWVKPVGEMLIHMIEVMLKYLRTGLIPFYFAPRQNLLKSIEPDEIKKIICSFEMVLHKLKQLSSLPIVDYNEVRSLFDKAPDDVSYENA